MRSDQSHDPGASLEAVRHRFVHWRSNRTGQRLTPAHLRRQAVSLLDDHCAFHVCRALGINASALRSWATGIAELDAASSEVGTVTSFVSLDAEPLPQGLDNGSAAASRLIVELPGSIRVHCGSVQCVADLLEALGVRNALAGHA